ncbi:ABC-type multidrug transport system fused ATPase/permease subunit [Brevundimonas bullata]|uniref:ABC-type multidrug transport system fused ATPase/permease subunit n=1 Tax=Brevundimonas bullata TaxID=13160 RepID=A0A7W7IPP5_9CAUL|nr:hypothetical protein [Brevundimonas bullata]MBB4798190.1 ABC-type multidrug transport system fused ATPase/permease subunit [Brevundimonas bullata]MBB6383496.1 ABC-type multidrug transport system fused ATPase/permease subunit [Brevundimonas bullata]
MLIAIPLLVVPVVIYNLVILLGGSAPDAVLGQASVLSEVLFRVPMTSGAVWSISVGDLILFLSLILLFVELLKSTSSQRVAIVNHALSMALFVVCLVEFLLLPGFAGSVFLLILTMVLLDVLAGFIVTIIASRRDFDMNPR